MKDTKDIIINIFNEKGNIQYEKSKNERIKNLGISSITFISIVIRICKELDVDLMHLENSLISTENSIDELIKHFNSTLGTTAK